MKRILLLTTLLLAGCTTAEQSATQAIVDPIAVGFVSGLGQSYGIPAVLTAPVLTSLLNDGWGMLAQKTAGNPIAQGAANPTVGATVAALNPTTAQLVSAIGTLTLAKTNPTIANALLVQATPVKTSAWPAHGGYFRHWHTIL